MASRALMTAEEFAHLHPAEIEDYELVDGELIPRASGTPFHNFIRDTVAYHFRTDFRQNPIGRAAGETDCRIGEDIVRRPDLSVFLGDHWSHLDLNQTPVSFAPDIAVEVLSPSEHGLEVDPKSAGIPRRGEPESMAA